MVLLNTKEERLNELTELINNGIKKAAKEEDEAMYKKELEKIEPLKEEYKKLMKNEY